MLIKTPGMEWKKIKVSRGDRVIEADFVIVNGNKVLYDFKNISIKNLKKEVFYKLIKIFEKNSYDNTLFEEEKWFYEEEDLNSRFEFENNHYKRSMNTLKKIPEIMKEYEDNKGKEKVYDETSDNEKERILTLIYYHKVKCF